MTAKDAIRAALQAAQGTMLGLARDLHGEQLLAQPTAAGGNHALWILGHVAVSETGLLAKAVLDQDPAIEEQDRARFATGSTPTTDAADYPGVEELIARCQQARAQTLDTLDTLPEAELDAAPHAFEGFLATKGQALAFLAVHQAFHAGQLADCRRRLGRKPLMA